MKKENLFKKHFNIDKPLKLGCMIVLLLCILSGMILLIMGEFWFSFGFLALIIPAFIWLYRYSPAA